MTHPRPSQGVVEHVDTAAGSGSPGDGEKCASVSDTFGGGSGVVVGAVLHGGVLKTFPLAARFGARSVDVNPLPSPRACSNREGRRYISIMIVSTCYNFATRLLQHLLA